MCAICLGELEVEDMVKEMQCGHCFHTPCLDEWLRRQFVCPLCKRVPVAQGNLDGDSSNSLYAVLSRVIPHYSEDVASESDSSGEFEDLAQFEEFDAEDSGNSIQLVNMPPPPPMSDIPPPPLLRPPSMLRPPSILMEDDHGYSSADSDDGEVIEGYLVQPTNEQARHAEQMQYVDQEGSHVQSPSVPLNLSTRTFDPDSNSNLDTIGTLFQRDGERYEASL